MGNRLNPLAEALRIVEASAKYKKNKVVMAIMTTLDFSRQMLEHELSLQAKHREMGYYPFMGYVEGTRGKRQS